MTFRSVFLQLLSCASLVFARFPRFPFEISRHNMAGEVGQKRHAVDS